MPDRFLREVVDFDLPREGHYATGIAFLPARPERGRRGRQGHREDRRQRGPAGPRLARRAHRRLDDRRLGPGRRAVVPPALPGRRRPRTTTSLERRVFIVRKRVEHELGPLDDEGGVYFPSLSCRTLVYKGMLTTPQLRRVLPRPRRRAGRVGAGAGALAVLHQHVPVVAAGPPVPLRRPQRRDQHGPGQPQLDAGPRGAARQRPAARRPRAHLPDLHARRLPTRPPSTRRSSCCTWAATRCPTPC